MALHPEKYTAMVLITGIICFHAFFISLVVSYHIREAEFNRLAIQRGMVQVRTEGGSIIWTLPQQPAQTPKAEKP